MGFCVSGGNASVTGGENQPEGAGGWWGTRWERDSSTPLRFAQNDMWGVCLARDEIGLREDGSPHSRGQEGSEVCDWHGRDGCGLREDGSPHSRGQEGVPPPSPVFTRAGFNLTPSRGKGLVGAGWAIFLVMTLEDGQRRNGWRAYWQEGRLREERSLVSTFCRPSGMQPVSWLPLSCSPSRLERLASSGGI